MPTAAKEPLRTNIDAQLKRDATAILDSYGISMTTAITMYLRQIVIDGGIPFTVQDPFWSARNQAAIRHSLAQMDAGETHEYDSAGDFRAAMNARVQD